MIDNIFRERFERLVRPGLGIIQLLKLSPNQITVSALLISLVAAFYVSYGYLYLALALWWLSRSLDGLDGIYARYSGQESLFGSYLDICSDMLAYSSIIYAFALFEPRLSSLSMAILIMYVMSICSALSLGSLEKDFGLEKRDNRGLRFGAGLCEGGETGAMYTLFCLFPAYLDKLMFIWLLLLILSVALRSVLAYRVLRGVK